MTRNSETTGSLSGEKGCAKMSENSSRLKREANMLDVVKFLYGNRLIQKGDAYFMQCPNPAHEDKHASCYTKNGWNNITCTSCGYYSQAIDLITMEKNVSFSEACDILWELEGQPSWYRKFNRNQKKQQQRNELSLEELTFLDLRDWGTYLSKEEFKIIAFKKCRSMYERYKNMGDMENALKVNLLAKKIRDLK